MSIFSVLKAPPSVSSSSIFPCSSSSTSSYNPLTNTSSLPSKSPYIPFFLFLILCPSFSFLSRYLFLHSHTLLSFLLTPSFPPLSHPPFLPSHTLLSSPLTSSCPPLSHLPFSPSHSFLSSPLTASCLSLSHPLVLPSHTLLSFSHTFIRFFIPLSLPSPSFRYRKHDGAPTGRRPSLPPLYEYDSEGNPLVMRRPGPPSARSRRSSK